MVALPPQLFFNTQIPPACLWFLAKDSAWADAIGAARRFSLMLASWDGWKTASIACLMMRILQIANAYHAWRRDGETSEDM